MSMAKNIQAQEALDKAKPDYTFRISVMGAPGVGKTTLLNKEISQGGPVFSYKMWVILFETTDDDGFIPKFTEKNYSIAFKTKSYQLNDAIWQAQYWDACGELSELVRTARYCAGSAGFVFVYDVTNPDTFTYLEMLIAELAKFKGCGPYIPKLIIGNKQDLVEELDVDLEEMRALSEKASSWSDLYGAIFIETWNMETEKIEQSFSLFINSIVKPITTRFDPVFLAKRGIFNKKPMNKSQQMEQQKVQEHLALGNSNITYDMNWM